MQTVDKGSDFSPHLKIFRTRDNMESLEKMKVLVCQTYFLSQNIIVPINLRDAKNTIENSENKINCGYWRWLTCIIFVSMVSQYHLGRDAITSCGSNSNYNIENHQYADEHRFTSLSPSDVGATLSQCLQARWGQQASADPW